MAPSTYDDIYIFGGSVHFGDIIHSNNNEEGDPATNLIPRPQTTRSTIENIDLELAFAASSALIPEARLIPRSYKQCPCGVRPQSAATHRMLGGAIVSTTHKCKGCSRSQTRTFIRTPNWLTQYNLYVIGSPERILKLQRKVPWGSEENVLKHCLTGNIEAVKELLLSRQASLYDIDPNHGRTALHYAVQKGHVEICKVLLYLGADPEFEDYNGTTAEWKAWEHVLSRRGSLSTLEGFRNLFPNFDQDEQSFSHLHSVIVGERPLDVVAELSQARCKAQINSRDIRGRTPLHWACDRGDEAGVVALIDAGADLNIRDSLGTTPLIFAASRGNMLMLEKMLSCGADVRSYTQRGDSPLHFASRHQREVAPVQMLVEAGGQLDHKNNMGNTALVGAAIMNRVEVGRYLIEAGTDVETRGMYGDTPVFETIYHNSHDFLTMLLSKGVQTRTTNRIGNTVLHAAALEGDVETIKILGRSSVRLPDTRTKNVAGEDAREMLSKRLKAPEGFGVEFQMLLSQANVLRTPFEVG